MKMQSSLRIVFAGVLFLLLNACATYPQSGRSALVGTWTNSLGTVWMIKTDGTFDVDLKHQGKRDAWGTYTVSGPGVYKFTRPDKDSLHFALASDACKLRKKNVLLAWHRK